ncbi:hypothetical protein QFC22_006200 [Naganishia vaughanmartiniae]|uniref:Uncharacterized protein n=1 Tax=Naganishia vaughanmartiniae TaxID=1424756 RepID=A0ACC2WMQ8_9TREE|nr:hypothetical protein QFC22_006200 [Naganishia vaughanmartiniae]
MNTDIIRVINGRAGRNANLTNEQNRVWAARLTDVALAAPQNPRDGQRLPTDVLVVVAELLAGDRDLYTLSKLNVETVIFADEKAFERPVRYTNPEGWKYVKFLCVSKLVLPLLHLHLRYQTREDSPSTHDLLTTFFPRLILLGSTDVTSPDPPLEHGHPLHLTLYKPTGLDRLLEACIPYGSYENGAGITFFGTPFIHNVAQDSIQFEPEHRRDIVALNIRPGAFIVNDAAVGMDGWRATFSGMDFRIDIVDDVDQRGVEETLHTVMNHLALSASKNWIRQYEDITLKIKCTPLVLDKIIGLIDLTVPVTKGDMKRYLVALGSVYQQHWRVHAHHPAEHQLFLQIHACAPALDSFWWGDYHLDADPEAAHLWMQWHGQGQFGYDGRPDFDEDGPVDNMGNAEPLPRPPGTRPAIDERSGFVLSLSRDLMFKERHEDGFQFWSRSYRVAVPPLAVWGLHAVRRDEGTSLVSENPKQARFQAQVQALRRAQGMEAAILQHLLPPDLAQPLPDGALDIAHTRVVDMDIAEESEADDEPMDGNGFVER